MAVGDKYSQYLIWAIISQFIWVSKHIVKVMY